MKTPDTHKQARTLRSFRKWHRSLGIALFLFFTLVAISGGLLGLKKHSGELLMPKTYTGKDQDPGKWLPMSELLQIAQSTAVHTLRDVSEPELDKIDVRPSKGIMKFIYKDDNLEVQLDATTGEVLQTGKRYADWLEDLHDGSLIDSWTGNKDEPVKVIYTQLMALSLLAFCITGLWLWYGPKQLRKHKKNEHQ